MTIPESICTVVLANLWPIPLADLYPATRFSKRKAKLPNRLPRIRILSIRLSGRLARTMCWSRSPIGLKFAGSFRGGTLLKSESKTDFSTKLQAAGVNATAYAAKLPGGHTSVIILNKDAAADLEVELDFGRDASGVVQTETLHAPALDSREAHITTSTTTDSIKAGQVLRYCSPCDGSARDPELNR
jgi:hypothetical protein